MELYRSLGIDAAIREAGSTLAPSMGILAGPSLASVIEPKPRKEGTREIPFTDLFAALSPEKGQRGTQDVIEPVLLKAAREKGGEVRFHVECLGVEQDETSVTATLRDRDSGETSVVKAEYCIAADGAGSPIRKQLGAKTTGQGTLGHMLNILFHADLKALVDKREFSICVIERPEVRGLFTSINNSDRWVFHLSYDPAKGESPEDFPPERCVELLRLASGILELDIEIVSILPWEPSAKWAEQLQHGRIFLAGDAAHQMTPYAGQGANSGIEDAHNLAWKLAAVLAGHANPELLVTYDAERRPVAKIAVEVSAAAADERGILAVKKSFKTAWSMVRRLYLISGLGYNYTSRAIAEESTSPLGGITWRAWTLPSLLLSLDGRPGTRVPHIWVVQDGKRISTIDLCGKKFVLLVGSDGQPWKDAAKKTASSVGVDLEVRCVGPNGDLVDEKDEFRTAAGISARGALLVRPDGFVAWRERRQAVDFQDRLEMAMKKVLCL
jgi:putative polyketide hydroxylase